jgi:hypothetical protein
MTTPTPRLVARPQRRIILHVDLLPGKGWTTSTLVKPRGYGLSIEYLLETDEDASALFVNCRDADVREVAEFLTDPAAALELQLSGARSFSARVEGRLREIGGLPGKEIMSLVEDQVEGSLYTVSGALLWQAQAVSRDRDLVLRLLGFAETVILPQFLEG